MIESILEFAFTASFDSVEPIIEEFCSDFPELNQIECVRFADNQMDCAVNCEILNIVKYLLKKGLSWPKNACDNIVMTGNVGILAYALETGCVLSGTECYTAARYGNLRCLKYLHEVLRCPWNELTPYNAVLGGHLDCFVYAHEHGCPWNTSTEESEMPLNELCYSNICTIAVVNDEVECLKYAHSQGVPFIRSLLGVIYVHQNSNTLCFEYAREQGAAWTSGLYERAIVKNNFTLLQYLCDNGCPWDGADNCTTAVEYRRLKHLQYLHEKGCPWSAETCAMAVEMGHTDILLYLLRNDCPLCSHLWTLNPCDAFEDVVQCFVESGYTWDLTPAAILDCLLKTNFNGLKLLIENGCPWYPDAFNVIIYYENFEMFKWVRALGAPWPEQVCLWLAEKGLIDWLQYAHTHGAAISPDTCERLLQSPRLTSQHVECFVYAHQKGGCMLHQEYAVTAAREGQLELLSYLKSQGCGV